MLSSLVGRRRASAVRLGAALSCLLQAAISAAQESAPPTLRAAPLSAAITINGVLDEGDVDGCRGDRRIHADRPSRRRNAHRTNRCPRARGPEGDRHRYRLRRIPTPSGIVSFSVRRDAALTSEDHVRVVLGPFLDGRSGYVFSVNPSGARYDGLINPGGESDNPDWDGIWEAATERTATGWNAEIWIPIQTLSFNPSLREWHFNVQRRIQRTPRNRSLGVSRAAVSGDANEPRRAPHRIATSSTSVEV